jgi:thiol-disulfide isomerase/thioredoxin
MKQISFLLVFLSFTALLNGQGENFELKVTFKPFKKQYIYLGYYYGKQKPILDSVLLDDNSVGVFRAARKMEKGIYLIGYPGKTGYFEIVVDKEQRFSIIADTARVLQTIQFENSPDNTLFNGYQKFAAEKGSEIENAKAKLAAAKNKNDSARLIALINKNTKELEDYRKNLIKQYPTSTIAALLNAMKDPQIPPADTHPGGKYDTLFAYRYYKNHFWDDVQFYDERLVRTPFFEEKLDRYFNQLVALHPDSVIKEIDWMLGYASINEEMQRFLLIKFVNRYLNQKYMWEDKVFVHLFEKYFSQNTYAWLPEKGKKTIFDRAYSLMANLFGSQAADMQIADSTGKQQPLFSIKNPYTVVVFWDPSCGHCKETLPQIDSIYRLKWKAADVAIYAVSKETDAGKKDWLKFINDHHLQGWTHVYYSKTDESARVSNNIPGYLQLYDVQTVPTLYLLDKDKRILAKKIPFEQIDEVLQYKLKGQ